MNFLELKIDPELNTLEQLEYVASKIQTYSLDDIEEFENETAYRHKYRKSSVYVLAAIEAIKLRQKKSLDVHINSITATDVEVCIANDEHGIALILDMTANSDDNATLECDDVDMAYLEYMGDILDEVAYHRFLISKRAKKHISAFCFEC